MSMRALGIVVALGVAASVAIAGDAPSPFTNPRIVPAIPTAGQPVSLLATWFGCGFVGTASVRQSGNTLEIVVPYNAMCGIPLPPSDITVPLGAPAAGNYVARLIPCNGDSAESCQPQAPMADVPFSVRGSTSNAVSAPASGPVVLVLVAFGLVLLGWRTIRARTVG